MNYLISIILCSLVILFVLYKRLLTIKATIFSVLCAAIVIYVANLRGLIMILATFLLLEVADKISKTFRKEEDDITAKTGRRDSVQIIANIGVAVSMMILYYLTKNEIYLIAYGISLAESLADSFASDLGMLHKGKFYDVFTFKESKKGLSGVISIFGLFWSFIGAFLIGIIFCLVFNKYFYLSFFIALLGFLGAYFDSILGCLIQVKYKCSKCKKITEKKIHCNVKTEYYSGNKIIDNDVVNFLSNVIITIIALLILK